MSDAPPKMPRTYTAEQVGSILQVPEKTVYVMGAAGELPGRIQVGRRRTRFDADAIDAFVRGGAE